MHRRSIIWGLLGTCAALNSKVWAATAWELITQDQFDEVNRPKAAGAAGSQGGKPILVPVIEIVDPDVKNPITSPVRIRIRFQAPEGASINPASFRATYGWFDITDKLVSHAKIDASGISADDAQIPKGKYEVTLQISDNKGRVGTQAINFQVV